MIRPNYWGVVMLFKVLSQAMLASVLLASAASAQSLSQLGGPANLPPPGFTGQQFVDSRGCVFMKAGFGSNVTWVARVSRDYRPLCGFPPSFGQAVIAAVEAAMAPDPEAGPPPSEPATPPVQVATVAPEAPQAAAPSPQVTTQRPQGGFLAMLFGPQTRRAAQTRPAAQAAPIIPAMPVQVAAPAAPTAPPAQQLATAPLGDEAARIQCFTQAPRLERVLLRSGGTALVCTRGDGTLTGWRPPRFPQGAGVGAALGQPALSDGVMAGATMLGAPTSSNARTAAANAVPTPPKGYRLAWTDDRLNPLRGQGTAQGQAQQDQVWTRDIPAVLVAQTPQAQAPAARQPAAQVTVSTMSAPATEAAQPQAGGTHYVQVGSFGLPENAEGAKARLRALGLPVSTSQITRKGKVLQVVYAGPFSGAAAAQQALAATRGAGFSDAILR